MLYTTGSDKNCAFNILGAGDNIIATEHQDENDIASYHFYNKDLMGSTTNILGAALTSEVTYDYDWFGNTEVFEPTGTDFYNQICYNGGVYDESTQLYYRNARFYNPADGRFLSQDTYRGTIEDANSWHLYAYCANNPVKYSDPTGHFVWFAIGAAFAIYDGVKAYKKAKKEGKSGWRAVGAVVKSVAVGAVVGKIGKAYKATKKVYQIGKKVFKSKPLKKLYGKTKKYKGTPKKITISKAANGKKKAPSLSHNEAPSNFSSYIHAESRTFEKGFKPQKGKDFRGGSKKQRDNWFGYDKNKEFVKWWHRIGKKEFGEGDIKDSKMAKEIYEYWVGQGKPKVK